MRAGISSKRWSRINHTWDGALSDRPSVFGGGSRPGLRGEQRRELRSAIGSGNGEAAPASAGDSRARFLPKSPAGAAVRYALNQWQALGGFWRTAIWRSTTAPRSGPTATSRLVAALDVFR